MLKAPEAVAPGRLSLVRRRHQLSSAVNDALESGSAGVFLQLFDFGFDRVELIVRLLLAVLLRLA